MKLLPTRSPWREQTGEGWVGTLIWGLVAVVVIIVGVKMLRPKYNEYVLESKLEEIVRMQGSPDAEHIKREVMEMAVRQQLPIDEEAVTVTKNGSTTIITVVMDQPVDLIFTKYMVHAEVEKRSSSY